MMAEINTTWEYNGQKFTLDMNDLDDLERFDKAKQAQQRATAKLLPGANEARDLIAYCEGIRALFDTLFGEGTAEKLLGNTKKPTDYDAVFESFYDFLYDQTKEIAERRAKMLAKYKPNREQRRILEKK